MWSFAHVRNIHDVWISALVRLVHLLHTVTQCGATFCGGYWWITSDRHHPDASYWRCHPIYIPLPILLSRPLQFHFVSVFSSCLLSHKVFTVTMEFSYVVAHEWNDNILILFICNSVLFNQYFSRDFVVATYIHTYFCKKNVILLLGIQIQQHIQCHCCSIFPRIFTNQFKRYLYYITSILNCSQTTFYWSSL